MGVCGVGKGMGEGMDMGEGMGENKAHGEGMGENKAQGEGMGGDKDKGEGMGQCRGDGRGQGVRRPSLAHLRDERLVRHHLNHHLLVIFGSHERLAGHNQMHGA